MRYSPSSATPTTTPDLLRHRRAEQRVDVVGQVVVARRQDHRVEGHDRPVTQQRSLGDEAIDQIEVEDRDLALDDRL